MKSTKTTKHPLLALMLLAATTTLSSCGQTLNHFHFSAPKEKGVPDIVIYRQGNKLVADNGEDKRVLAELKPRIDFQVNISTTKNCLHILAPSMGIQSYCNPRDKFQLSSLKRQKIQRDNLPQRTWYGTKDKVSSFKRARFLRRGQNDRFYFVSPYSLSAARSPMASKGQGWHYQNIRNRDHDAISDVVEVSRNSRTYLLVGTPYNGLKRARVSSKNDKITLQHWQHVGKNLPKRYYIRSLPFHEAINSLAQCGEDVYAALGFGQGLWRSQDQGRSFKKLSLGPAAKDPGIRRLFCSHGTAKPKLYLSGTGYAAIYDPSATTKKQKIKKINTNKIPQRLVQSKRLSHNPKEYWLYLPQSDGLFHITSARQGKPNQDLKQRKGLYIPAHHARGKRLKRIIKQMKNTSLNSLVIDFKDDYGRLVYNSKLPLAQKIHANRKIINTQKLTRIAHKHGISIIARLVTFKDKRLYYYKNHKYTFAKKGSRRPWQYNREYWVDARCRPVWDYNIDIAKELARLGVDEIQFDYIRFPTDGPTHLIRSRCHSDKHRVRSEVLYDFLAQANQEIDIPIGIDVYGFNAWYQAGVVLGQDIALLSHQVQVISPMFYPSHFGHLWYNHIKPRSKRSYAIMYYGTRRARKLVAGKTLIRPYLQAFRWRAPTFGPTYHLNQIQGVYDAGSTSYLFWNAGGKYGTLFHGLKDYNPKSYKAK